MAFVMLILSNVMLTFMVFPIIDIRHHITMSIGMCRRILFSHSFAFFSFLNQFSIHANNFFSSFRQRFDWHFILLVFSVVISFFSLSLFDTEQKYSYNNHKSEAKKNAYFCLIYSSTNFILFILRRCLFFWSNIHHVLI